MRSSRSGYGPHSFLNDYISKNKCKKIMEIGVADGENARTMVMVALRNFSPEEVEYYGFDFFGGALISLMLLRCFFLDNASFIVK
jgi:hypothetical protein